MSKVRCSSCGAVFSSHKKNCPECGRERNKGGARLKPGAAGGNGRNVLIIVLIIAIILCLVILAKLLFFSGKPAADPDTPTPPVTDTNPDNTGDNLDLPTIIDVDGINGGNTDTPGTPDTPYTPDTPDTPVVPDTPETVTVTGIKLNTLYDNANSCYDAALSKGEKFQFKATTTPEGEAVTWAVENTNIATVTEDGAITAVASGTTKMTVTAGGYTVECVIRVK